MSGGYDGTLKFNTKVDTSGFNRGVKTVNSGLDGLTAGFKKLGAAVGLAFGFAALVKLGQTAMGTASDLAEVQNVVDTAFGDMAYKAEDFGKRAIDQFGMSELAAKKTASTYMAMSKSMGLGKETASDMAISVAELTGDVASFYNISQDLAATKLKGIWTGETEALKDLGVVMTQTNLQAYAVSKGIEKNISKMTQAEQVTLRYQYVTEQLALAQGDFAKTSGSWANQTRILSERFHELLGIVGTGLIEALTPGLQILNQLVSKMIDFANVLAGAFGMAFGSADEVGDSAAGSIEGAADAAGDLTDNTNAATEAAKKAVAGFDELNKLSAPKSLTTNDADAPQLGDGLSGLSGLLDGKDKTLKVGVEVETDEAQRKIADMLQKWKNMTTPTVEAFDRLVAAMEPLKTFAAQGLNDFYNHFLLPVSTWSLGTGIPRFLDACTKLAGDIDWAGLNAAFDRMWEALEPFAEYVGEGLLWFFENVIAPAAEWAANCLIPAALNLISAALDGMRAVLDALAPAGKWLWENFLEPLRQFVWDIIINAINWLTNQLTRFSDWARENPEVIRKIGEIILVFFGVFLAYEMANIIGNIVNAIGSFGSSLMAMAGSSQFATTSILLLVAAVLLVMQAWGDMSPVERAIAVIALLVGTCLAAAIAVGALQSAWSLGVAAAAIVAGVVAIRASIQSATRDAENAQKTAAAAAAGNRRMPSTFAMAGVPKLAAGAVIPPNAEFLAVLGDQKQGRNFEAPEGLLRQIVRDEMAGFKAGPSKVEIQFTGSLAQLGRVLHPVVTSEGRRVGAHAVKGGTHIK